MERVIIFTSLTQGNNPMAQPHPQDTDSVLKPAGFHMDHPVPPLSEVHLSFSSLMDYTSFLMGSF